LRMGDSCEMGCRVVGFLGVLEKFNSICPYSYAFSIVSGLCFLMADLSGSFNTVIGHVWPRECIH